MLGQDHPVAEDSVGGGEDGKTGEHSHQEHGHSVLVAFLALFLDDLLLFSGRHEAQPRLGLVFVCSQSLLSPGFPKLSDDNNIHHDDNCLGCAVTEHE